MARGIGGNAVGDIELLVLASIKPRQPRIEGLRGVRQLRLKTPVFARNEGFDLFFALSDHAQRRALHTTGGQAALHFAPQHRAQIETHQIVEGTTRLLRIDQVGRQHTRIGHRLFYRTRGDFSEHHAVQLAAFQQSALFQYFGDMPADRFALAVWVGRQIQRRGTARGPGNGFDVLLVFVDQRVVHRKAVLGIHCAFFRHQIAHVAKRGQHLKVFAQVFVDRLGLGWRFDDEQILGHADS